MALEFVENVTLVLPDIANELASFSESEFRENHGMIIEIAAIHEGLTANYNMYTKEALEASLDTWVTPYPKPIIRNHDVESEPIGRVMGAKLDQEADGTPFVRLQVAITDPEAITKVADKRYLTGSVGGRAQEAHCSVCDIDWAAHEGAGMPCKHQRGKVYNGKVASFELKGIGWKEYSFVNVPADSVSGVRSTASEDSGGWVTEAKVYSVDMGHEDIIEFSEADGSTSVLDNLKKKEATPLYLGIKGAFLSALSYDIAENNSKKSKSLETDTTINIENHDKTLEETDMTVETETSEEDILALTEELSDDLATQAASGAEADEETADEVVEETEVEEETPAEESETEDEQAEEVVESEDDDAKSEEVNEGEETEETELSEETDSDESPDAEEAADEPDVELTEAQAQIAALVEENTKLKSVIKKMLAERVVDTKIAAGMLEADDRETALTEHLTRSVSSLTDSIRDLSSVSFRQDTPTPDLTINDKTKPTSKEDGRVVTASEEETTPEKPVEDVFTEKMVDVLMGRAKLQ